MHGAAGAQSLEQAPLRAGEILEAVGEDGAPVPGVELAGDALDRAAPQEAPIPEAERVELLAVGGVQPRHVAVELLRIEQPGVELGERGTEGLGEAGEARGATESVERGHGAADDEVALGRRRHRTPVATGSRESLEEIVEGADGPREERRPPSQQVTLDAVDVRSVGHDQDWIAVEHLQVTIEEQRDLAGIRRPDDQRESHGAIVVRPCDGAPSARRVDPANSALSRAE